MLIMNKERTNENCGTSCNLTCNYEKCRNDWSFLNKFNNYLVKNVK